MAARDTGRSVHFFKKSPSAFSNSHKRLYSRMLKPLAVAALLRAGAHENISRRAAETRAGELTPEEAFQVILDQGLNFPQCVVRQSPPEGMRVETVHVNCFDTNSETRYHGHMQPLLLEDPRRFSVVAFGAVTIGLNDGFCPYFLEAAANPAEIANFSLPLPSTPLLTSLVVSLNRLSEYYEDCFIELNNVDPTTLIELSLCIVLLSTSPSDVIFSTASPSTTSTTVYQTLDRKLAKFLLAAFRRGYVNIEKPTFSDQVRLIANTLGMPAEKVEQEVPYFRDDDTSDAKKRTTILFGTVVPFFVDNGQNNDNELVIDNLMKELAEGHQEIIAFDENPRVKLLQEGSVVVRPSSKRHVKLSLQSVYRHDRSNIAECSVDLKLSDLADKIEGKSAQQLRDFVFSASQPNLSRKALQDILEMHSLSDSGSSEFSDLVDVLRRQGNASISAQASSVIAFIHSDPYHLEEFQEIGELLEKKNGLSTFLVSFLSCMLRHKFHDQSWSSIPLATHALLQLSSPDEELSTEDLFYPGRILPPFPHHDAYFTVFDLVRKDIGYSLGVMLALRLKEGIKIMRGVLGFRSSFILWFIDDLHPFNLAQAIHRSHAPVDFEACEAWATRLIQTATPVFSKFGLQPAVDPPLAIQAINTEFKFIALISWGEQLHGQSIEIIKSMLAKTHAAKGFEKVIDLKFQHLDCEQSIVQPRPT